MTLAGDLAHVLGDRDLSYQRLARLARRPPGEGEDRPWWPACSARRLRELVEGAEPSAEERRMLAWYCGLECGEAPERLARGPL